MVANGIELEAEVLGDDRAPAIVLIRGLGTQMSQWPTTFLDGLLEAGLCVVRFDNRDAGLSQGFDGMGVPSLGEVLRGEAEAPYTLIDMADDVAGLLDALAIERAHILGISMGGMIAQIFAERHAGRTRSLISFMSTSGAPGLPAPTPEAMQTLLSQPEDPKDRESIIEHAMRSRRVVEGPKLRDHDEELREELAAATDRARNPAGIARQMAAIAASGSRESILARIEVPTLVMHGDADPLVPLEGGRDTAARISGAQLEIIEGLGHNIPRRVAPTLAARVSEHCSQADRR